MKFICASGYAADCDTPALYVIEAEGIEQAVIKFVATKARDGGEDCEYADPETLVECLNDIRFNSFEHIFEDLYYVTIQALDDIHSI